MTIEEFLTELEKEAPKINWSGKESWFFRGILEGKSVCPMTALASFKIGRVITEGYFGVAALELGLSVDDMYKLLYACDGAYHNKRNFEIKELAQKLHQILFKETLNGIEETHT